MDEPDQHFHKCAFPGSIGAEEAKGFPFPYGDGHVAAAAPLLYSLVNPLASIVGLLMPQPAP